MELPCAPGRSQNDCTRGGASRTAERAIGRLPMVRTRRVSQCGACGWRERLGMRARQDRRRLAGQERRGDRPSDDRPHDDRRSTGDADDRSRHTAPTPHAPSVCRSARCARGAGCVHGRRPRPGQSTPPASTTQSASPTTTTTTSPPSPTPSVDPVIAKIPAAARAAHQRVARPSCVLHGASELSLHKCRPKALDGFWRLSCTACSSFKAGLNDLRQKGRPAPSRNLHSRRLVPLQ